jgi:hypothetical protein
MSIKLVKSTKTMEEVRASSHKQDRYSEQQSTPEQFEAYVKGLIAEHGEDNVKIEVLAGGQVSINVNRIKKSDMVVDGHFWVEDPKTGKIIGDHTGQEHVAKFHRNGHSAVYMRANPADEARYIAERMAVVQKNIDKHFDGEEGYWNSIDRELQTHLRNGTGGYDCVQNATLIAHKTGFPLRYGHFGALKPDGKIYWYFGHPTNTYEDFEKSRTAGKGGFKDGETHKSQLPKSAIIVPPIKKQKPNEICACGSGKKHKKCCGAV